MGSDNPAELITAPLGGRDVKASRWAHAAWQHFADSLPDPSAFHVVQPSYNTGVETSAGTHDFDAVMDFQVFGMDYGEASQRARRAGIENWHRTPAQGPWIEHDHGFPIPPRGAVLEAGVGYLLLSGGHRTRVGGLIPQQHVDYGNHALGLAASVGGHIAGSDPQPHPDPQYVFDYERWLRDQEDAMPAWTDQIPGTTVTYAQLCRRQLRGLDALAAVRAAVNRIEDEVAALPDGATQVQVARFRGAMRDRLRVVTDALTAVDAPDPDPGPPEQV